MKTFLDSSALAKRYIEEPGSQAVDDICARASSLAVSVICLPEIVSALVRRRREKLLSLADYGAVKRHLLSDLQDALVINLTPPVIAGAIEVLETGRSRALDAIHVACAFVWGSELFVSADDRQLASAKKAGLKTRKV